MILDSLMMMRPGRMRSKSPRGLTKNTDACWENFANGPPTPPPLLIRSYLISHNKVLSPAEGSHKGRRSTLSQGTREQRENTRREQRKHKKRTNSEFLWFLERTKAKVKAFASYRYIEKAL